MKLEKIKMLERVSLNQIARPKILKEKSCLIKAEDDGDERERQCECVCVCVKERERESGCV